MVPEILQNFIYFLQVADDELQPATDVQMIISLERIKVVNLEGKVSS